MHVSESKLFVNVYYHNKKVLGGCARYTSQKKKKVEKRERGEKREREKERENAAK